MKTKFSKGLSIFLSIVLVISVLALPNVFNVAANGELPTEVTRKLITEADNDYQSSAALIAPYATKDDNSIHNWFSVQGGRNYSGTIVPTYDPLDTTGENKVLRHRPYGDAIGIIRLGDEYLTPTTTGGIIAEVGKTYKISFLGKDFIIGNYKNIYDLPFEETKKDFSFFGIKIPINVIITRYFSVKEDTITYTFEEGRKKSFELLELKEKNEMNGMEIISKKTEESIKNGKYIIKADYVVLMNIAEEQQIESDVAWENTDDMS